MKQFLALSTHYFFFLSLPLSFFSFFLSALSLGISFFLSMLIQRNKSLTKDEIWFFVFLTFPFIITLISGVQSFYFNNASTFLSRMTPFLICPFVFMKLSDIDNKTIGIFKILITVPIIFISLEGLIKGLVFYYDKELFFPHYIFDSIFRIQHTYLVLYLLFCCILWLLGTSFKNKIEKITKVVLVVITLLTLFIVKARFAVLFLLLISFLFVIRNRKLQNTIILTVILIVAIFFTWDKFFSIFSGQEARVLFWKCAISLIDTHVFFTGIHAGDLQEMLNSCYYSESMKLGYEGKNTHNQFLSIFLSGGILALLTYLFLIVKVFILQKNHVFRTSLLLIVLMSFTENIFERQHGILFICIALGTTYYLIKKP